MPLSCTHPECNYAKEDLAKNLADMMKIHTMTCHTSTTLVGTPSCQTQAKKVKRPILIPSGKMLDPEEYEHFVNTLTQFKDRLGDDLDGATPLRECLVTDISG